MMHRRLLSLRTHSKRDDPQWSTAASIESVGEKGKKLRTKQRSVYLIVLYLSFLVLIITVFTVYQSELHQAGSTFHSFPSNEHPYGQADLLGSPITILERMEAYHQLHQAKLEKASLFSMDMKDREQYTVRLNTWRRRKELIASLHHLSACPGVAQIQIIWCDHENDPPMEEIRNLNEKYNNTHPTNHEKIILEYHEKNSLNERFNIIAEPPTKGILSIDDDVLRPCEAIDSGFFRWVDHPDRIVGFDYRLHISKDKDDTQTENIDQNPTWKYGYLSSTKKAKKYSMTLPRFCFIHRDYLNLYMKYLPPRILRTIDENLNCEDIGMSFFVSALTEGRAPLLGDRWAVNTMVKIGKKGISSSGGHKKKRDQCVDIFGFLLGLKDGFSSPGNHSNAIGDIQMSQVENIKWGKLKSEKIFGKGSEVGLDPDNPMGPRRKAYIEMLESWKSMNKPSHKLVKELKARVRSLGL